VKIGEASFQEIQEEERYSRWVAKKEDERELRYISKE
jgi:hypothetical protein